MTDIEAKALALVNKVRREYPNAADYTAGRMALCRAIEAHEATKWEAAAREAKLIDAMRSDVARAEAQREATEQKLHDFKQKVSDAVETHFKSYFTPYDLPDIFKQFIIKPDPLVEALEQIPTSALTSTFVYAAKIRAALEAAGFEIREKGQ